MKDW